MGFFVSSSRHKHFPYLDGHCRKIEGYGLSQPVRPVLSRNVFKEGRAPSPPEHSPHRYRHTEIPHPAARSKPVFTHSDLHEPTSLPHTKLQARWRHPCKRCATMSIKMRVNVQPGDVRGGKTARDKMKMKIISAISGSAHAHAQFFPQKPANPERATSSPNLDTLNTVSRPPLCPPSMFAWVMRLLCDRLFVFILLAPFPCVFLLLTAQQFNSFHVNSQLQKGKWFTIPTARLGWREIPASSWEVKTEERHRSPLETDCLSKAQ